MDENEQRAPSKNHWKPPFNVWAAREWSQGAVGKRAFEKEAGRKLRKHGALASLENLVKPCVGSMRAGRAWVQGQEMRSGWEAEKWDWKTEGKEARQGKVQDRRGHLLGLMGRPLDQEDVEGSGAGPEDAGCLGPGPHVGLRRVAGHRLG